MGRLPDAFLSSDQVYADRMARLQEALGLLISDACGTSLAHDAV